MNKWKYTHCYKVASVLSKYTIINRINIIKILNSEKNVYRDRNLMIIVDLLEKYLERNRLIYLHF
jgi:hypothetical protein